MPEWLILLAVLWVVVGISRRSGGGFRCGRPSRGGFRRRWLDEGRPGDAPGRERIGRRRREPKREVRGRELEASRRTRAPSMPPRRETEEERLQREFVDGRLTIEEYEDALTRMLRGGRSTRR